MVNCRRFSTILLMLTLVILMINAARAQQSDSLMQRLPEVTIKTVDNQDFKSSAIANEKGAVILIFWKSCCSPNIKMLDAINEVYAEWQEETGVLIYAVSVDDARSSAAIAPLVNGKGWEFTILLDANADFKRAMNVNETPHIFILNENREVVWQKKTYAPGDEGEIKKVIESLKK